MFWAGVAESGILPWYVRQFARFNSAFNIPYAKDFKSSRYRNKAGTEILLGPPGNLIDASVQLTNKFLKGEIDKKAFFRLRRLLPLSWAFYLRPFFTDIKQQEIKRKKKEMNEKVNKATRKTKKNKNTDELNF